MARLKTLYYHTILPQLAKELNLTNLLSAPKLEKIVINCSNNRMARDRGDVQTAKKELFLITGQKPIETTARKSIAQFKIRKGFTMGVKTTLRNTRMYEFLDRFISITSPNIRDFKGFKMNFDAQGSFSIGLRNQFSFAELPYESGMHSRGMNICFVIKNGSSVASRLLFAKFSFPEQL